MTATRDKRKEARSVALAEKSLTNKDMMAAIAVTRFGLGAKPGELAEASRDPHGFLKSQIRRSGADQPTGQAVSTRDRMEAFRDFRRERREAQIGRAHV